MSHPPAPPSSHSAASSRLGDPDGGKLESVRVAVRARPLAESEKANRCHRCIRFAPDGQQIVLGKDRGFKFDFAFDENTTQEHIYESCVRDLLNGIFQGYNATVLAYGQTGAGKTFTMGSGISANTPTTQLGIIPRVIRELFELVRDCGAPSCSIRVSYLEIYNEEVRDLLHPDTPSKSIMVREGPDGGVLVVGMRDEEVKDPDDMYRCMAIGAANRITASTMMNDKSSRSHSIFTIAIQQDFTSRTVGEHANEFVSAKFHLVDLAGSERNKRTGASGQRFKESVSINQGLLALGNVISALSSNKGVKHVPYRESKLTRVLQDALGGNSYTVMLACVSPADNSLDETLNTLKYASRARFIKNTPVVNINPSTEHVMMEDLQSEIETLQQRLLQQQSAEPEPEQAQLLQSVMHQKLALEGQLRMLSEQLITAESDHEATRQRAHSDQGLLTTAVQAVHAGAHQLLAEMAESSLHEDTIFQRVAALVPERQVLQACGVELLAVPQPPERAGHSADAERVVQLEDTVQHRDAEIKNLCEQLEEARDDLDRDEEIFNDKMKQISALQFANQELQMSVEALREQCNQAQHAMSSMRKGISSRPQTSSSTGRPLTTGSSHAELVGQHEMEDEVLYTDDSSMIATEEEHSESEVAPADEAEVRQLKEELDHQRVELEQLSQKQASELQNLETRTARQMKDLTINIKQKQELIRMLVRNEQHAVSAKDEYESKVSRMEAELQQAHEELQQLIQQASQGAQQAEHTQAVMAQYEAKIAAREAQLRELKKEAQPELRISKLKAESDRKVRKFEAQIRQMEEQQGKLELRLREEQEWEEQQRDEHQRKLVNLRGAVEKAQRRVRDMETENAQQRSVIEKKTRQVEQLQKERQQHRKGGSSSAQQHLDEEIENYVSKQKAVEELERQLSAREEVLRQKEEALGELSKLELKRLRMSCNLRDTLTGVGAKLQAAQGELAAGAEDATAANDLSYQIRQLEQSQAHLQKQQEDESFLGEMDKTMLDELNERLENLDAELEYKTALVMDAEAQAGDRGAECYNSISKQLELVSPTEMKQLVSANIQKVIQARRDAEEWKHQEERLQGELTEKTNMLNDATEELRIVRLQHDQALMAMEKEHMMQRDTEITQGSTNELTQELETAQKDLFYYKQSYRELKRKLKQIQTAVKTDVDRSQAEAAALKAHNARLSEELANLKQHIEARSQLAPAAMQPVRMSLRDLKAVSAGSVRSSQTSDR